jgi:prepilin-type N-terminal cleavage/methylation domain-containing protein
MRLRRDNRQGFTLIEVLFATVILAIGLLAMLAALSHAMAAIYTSQEDQMARQEGQSALENIFTARDTSQISFAQIQNASNGGIFLDGFQPILDPGPDGLDGTIDDGAPQFYVDAGPDGILGTADDRQVPLTNFLRQIQILPVVGPSGVNPNLRQVIVTIRYNTNPAQQKTYTIGAYISSFR